MHINCLQIKLFKLSRESCKRSSIMETNRKLENDYYLSNKKESVLLMNMTYHYTYGYYKQQKLKN
jgi:hypothetical protein